MTRTVSVTRHRCGHGKESRDESRAFGIVVAHASAAIPDPETSRYVLPWTRLHALKDYWGMVAMLKDFPQFHATFNVVPSLGIQLEEYASGKFDEPWFALAFKPTEQLTREDKAEILARAFQLNHDHLMSRWPRFVELHEWAQPAGGAQAQVSFTVRDWRDVQVLSQLAWMEESWIEKDPVICSLASKGKEFTENDSLTKQLELLSSLRYMEAAQTGQVEPAPPLYIYSSADLRSVIARV